MANPIDFSDKVDLIDSPEVPDNQKIAAKEMNNIRDVINETYYRVKNLEVNGTVGGDTVPVGTMMNFTGDGIQRGWLVCDGSAISRTDYKDLFSVIGTKYGEGDGITTFNLPNGLEPIFYGSEASGILKLKKYNPALKIIIKAEQIVPIKAEVINDFGDASEFNTPSSSLVMKSFSNPNLLINGDFQVWQRGSRFTSNGYTADRWLLSGKGATVEKNDYFKVITTTEAISINQYIENNFVNLKLSASIKYIKNGVSYDWFNTITCKSNNNFETHVIGDSGMTLSVFFDTTRNATNFYLVIPKNTTVELVKVKLELGELSTPCVPRSYAEELMLCMRTTITYKDDEELRLNASMRYSNTSNDSMACNIFLPIAMRTVPSKKINKIKINANQSNNEYIGKLAGSYYQGNSLYLLIKKEDGSAFPVATDLGYTVVITGLVLDSEIY